MAERRASLMEPRMENLLDRVDSKFTLVTLAALRAREINDYYNQLGEGLGKIVPPQVTSVSRKPLVDLPRGDRGRQDRGGPAPRGARGGRRRGAAEAAAERRRRGSRPSSARTSRRRRARP